MTTCDGPTPAQLAHFDQVWAAHNQSITEITATHKDIVDTQGDREINTAGLAEYILEEIPHSVCAELLAVAIDRLAYGGSR